jgi:hypothetical protein
MRPEPQQPLAPPPVRPYGTDLERFMSDYPEFAAFRFPGGDHGARGRAEDGLIGALITALSLDELAAKLDACRRAGT